MVGQTPGSLSLLYTSVSESSLEMLAVIGVYLNVQNKEAGMSPVNVRGMEMSNDSFGSVSGATAEPQRGGVLCRSRATICGQ